MFLIFLINTMYLKADRNPLITINKLNFTKDAKEGCQEDRHISRSQILRIRFIPFHQSRQKPQSRWRYPTSQKPHQIRQMAKVHQNPKTKENHVLETQVTTSPQPIRANHRQEPDLPTPQAPRQVLPRDQSREERKTRRRS